MAHITKANIEAEITKMLEHYPLTFDNLERYVLLCKAMKYIDHTDREFTEEDAKAWVGAMDPPARWTMEQTNAVMKQYGYKFRPCVFYAVMNMLWSDSGKTVTKFGAGRVDLWAEMAKDFIDDVDAVDMKVGKYWRDIVRR